jgi:hypothetical protein
MYDDADVVPLMGLAARLPLKYGDAESVRGRQPRPLDISESLSLAAVSASRPSASCSSP